VRVRARLAVAVLVGPLAAGCAAPPCPGPAARIQFLLVNDVYQLEADAEGRGGLARVATLVRRLRRETPGTLFVLAGDTLSPSLLSTLFQGRQMVEAWNALGLDVATFGNHEFDFGPMVLRQRMGESRFGWMSSNVRDRVSGRAFGGAGPWLRRELGRVRVGLTGLTITDTAHSSNPGPDVVFEAPIASARAAFAAMGEVDVRVALTHLPLRQDRELAAAVELHVILGGHDHDPMEVEAGATLLVKAGADAVNVGRVELDVACDGAVAERRHRLIPVDASVDAAPDVSALVERYARLAERELDVEIGRTPRALDAREGLVRREATPVGTFLADVMRERMSAEVGLLNGGAIRGNRVILPGPITRRDVRALLPFNNTVVLVELPGAALRRALERSVSALPRPAGFFLQTAGLAYTADPARDPGRRVGGVEVGGRPLDPERRYRVAMPGYLAGGGDGYDMLAGGRVLVSPEEGPGLVETVLSAVARGRLP
jgi:5'-nucleotidase